MQDKGENVNKVCNYAIFDVLYEKLIIIRENFKKNRNYSLITTKNKIIVILSFKIVFLLIKRSLRHKLKNRNYFYLLM